jgi:hypothetical protein
MPDNQTDAPPPIQPPPTQAPPASPPPPAGSPESKARMWNMLCHLSALAACVGIPFGNILGPLIVWQLKKNEFPSVDIHGKAALNFQISVTIVLFCGIAAAFVLHFFCIGFLLFPIVGLIGLAAMVFAIIAGIKANNGEDYKYPWSLELVK